MNCSIHTQTPAAAYCRTCGKPLCEECKRDVRGVIYCEDCIVAGLQHTLPGPAPASGFVAATAAAPPASGPNPTVAGILAGFFPFGLGAVYNGEYAKGLAHMLFFAMLAVAIEHGDGATPLFGITMGFYYFYQIFDAVRSARAKQMGQPTPDPLNVYRALGISGGTGAPVTAAPSNAPIGAIILIGLGTLFLLSNMGILYFGAVRKLWPVILIALGIQMLRRRAQSADAGRQS
ncbi:MAG TPA: B-box zinc finger protein [Terriglobales bacterium]|nr:B-box zinc finger protein [Terriglobales bacterium]